MTCRAFLSFFLCLGMADVGRAEDLYFDSNGVKIHYVEEGSGEPVLLIHGFTADATMQWGVPGIRKALAREFRVIALDNRGHGKSGKPHDAGKYGLEMVEDAVRLLDHLKIKKAHVVGYSMGAMITLKLAVIHPDRVLSITLGGAGRMQEASFAACDKLADALEKDGDLGPFIAEMIGPGEGKLTEQKIKLVNALIAWRNDLKALAAVARGLRKLKVTEEEIKAIKVPTLAIVGAQDFIKASVDDLKGLPGLKTIVIDKCDHLTAFFSPLFLESLTTFLKQKQRVESGKSRSQIFTISPGIAALFCAPSAPHLAPPAASHCNARPNAASVWST